MSLAIIWRNHLASCINKAKDWYEWAAVYYELTEEAWDAVELLYETGELTRSMVVDLNAERDYDTIIDECTENGLFQKSQMVLKSDSPKFV